MLPFWISVFFALTLCCSTYAFAVKTDAPPLMHSHFYRSQVHPVQMYRVSEKLDGVRAYWDGKQLLTRQGYIIQTPYWFIQDFPTIPLDGELWMGRGRFDEVSGIVRSHKPSSENWLDVQYKVFDLPGSKEPFEARFSQLENLIGNANIAWLSTVEQHLFDNETSMNLFFEQVVSSGGEGLMLHRRDSYYAAKRVSSLLKYKPYFDDEAVVIAHIEGQGKYSGQLGSVLVEMSDGRRFKIGTGFSDQERQNPPPIGSTLTFEYSGLTSTGLPRFARFKRIRAE